MKKLALLTLLAVSASRANEVWVVGSAGKSVKVVDTASESVIATIPLLQDPQAPSAKGIAFSTADGQGGAFAFAGQGGTLHVLNAGEKTLTRSVDLQAALGVSLTIVDLESSPSRAFLAESGPLPRAYLFVAADASRGTGAPPEPYWIVLDQLALLSSPPPVPLVAAAGFLNDPAVPEEERGRAAGVSVLGSARGASFLRVWWTTRVAGNPEKMRAHLLEKGERLDAAWTPGKSAERVLPSGRRAPESFSVAVAHDGESQIFPTGASGVLVDLGHDGSCELPANLSAVAVRGPGAGGYQIVAVDLDSEELLRVNESSCAFQRTPLGSGPSDLTVDALFEHGSVWVANRDSDDVSVVRLDGSFARIALGPAPGGSCIECPISIEARKGSGSGCTTSLRLKKIPEGARLVWEGVGCSDVSYPVFCQCDPRLDLLCTCGCDPLHTPGCFGSLPVPGQPGVQNGLPGLFGPLARQLHKPDPVYPAYPPEPVIQLGITRGNSFDGGGGGGGTWIGTYPP